MALLPTDIDSLLRLIRNYILLILGDVLIPTATKKQHMMGSTFVEVIANPKPATGEMLVGAPKCTLFLNSIKVHGPIDMQPYSSMGVVLWRLSCPLSSDANYAKVEASFSNALLQTTTTSSTRGIDSI